LLDFRPPPAYLSGVGLTTVLACSKGNLPVSWLAPQLCRSLHRSFWFRSGRCDRHDQGSQMQRGACAVGFSRGHVTTIGSSTAMADHRAQVRSSALLQAQNSLSPPSVLGYGCNLTGRSSRAPEVPFPGGAVALFPPASGQRAGGRLNYGVSLLRA
jgi:hypothetical protein